MTKDQLQEISHIVWAAENLGREAAKARKKLEGVELDTRQALKVVLPDWFKKEEWHVMDGDAGKANSDYFQVYYRQKSGGALEIYIWCPTFLRGSGHLTLHPFDRGLGGSY